MKIIEVLGLAVFFAVQSLLFDSAFLAVGSWVLFGLWCWASFRAFKREAEAAATAEG